MLTISFLLIAFQSPSLEAPDVLEHRGVIAHTWVDQGVPHYRMSVDNGVTWSRERRYSNNLMLRYQEFDPLRGAPRIDPALTALSDGELHIVQFNAKGTHQWREEIRQLGADHRRFLANHADIWRMDSATAAKVSELASVRWVGAFHPAYKLENELLVAFAAGELQQRAYNIVVGERGPREKAVVAAAIRLLGGEVLAQIPDGFILEVQLNPAQLLAVLSMNEVLGLDRRGERETDMNVVRQKMGGDYVESMGGWDGTGVRAEVMDGNLDTSSNWTHSPIWHGSHSGSSSHGTSTFSINFSNGGTNANHRGMAPDAQGVFSDYGSFGNRYTHTAEMVDPAGNYRCVYQSNSWGDSRTTTYNSKSQEMDDIIYLNDVVITQSQSNAGSTDSRPQAWAKNVVAVGALYHYGNTNDSDDRWSSGASTGPASDGRIKPDLSAYYDQIVTTNSSSFGGTSAASPIVAGHFALFHEMWHTGIFANPTGATVFESRPHSTLARAMIINSAWMWPSNQGDVTRMRQGWGRPDLEDLYDNAAQTFWIDESTVLKDLESAAYLVEVPAGAPEFNATLVYIDRAGTTSSSLHRINDLSLEVIDPAGTVYWGNNGLTSSNTSSSGGTSDTKNPVERVIVSSPASGTWTIIVHADDINQDTHPENGSIVPDSDFALVVTPALPVGGNNTINLNGPTVGIPGGFFTWSWSAAPPNGQYWFAWSNSNAGFTWQGHDFDLGIPVNVIANGIIPSNGKGSFTAQIPSGASGITVYLEVAAKSGGNWFDSNMLTLTVL